MKEKFIMKKMNENTQRMTNGGAVVVNANAVVLVGSLVAGPVLISQSIVNVKKFKSTTVTLW